MKISATELKKLAWVYKVEPYWYEYHIEPQGFFCEVYAANAGQARIRGWSEFLKTKNGESYSY